MPRPAQLRHSPSPMRSRRCASPSSFAKSWWLHMSCTNSLGVASRASIGSRYGTSVRTRGLLEMTRAISPTIDDAELTNDGPEIPMADDGDTDDDDCVLHCVPSTDMRAMSRG